MNRVRPAVAAVFAVTGLLSVQACGTNPYAGTVQAVAVGAQQQPTATVPTGGAGQVKLVASTVDGLGPVLADGDGRTLYRYAKDSSGPPRVACAGACAEQWPPLVSDAPALVAGVDEKLVSLVTRPDGAKQVTVGGWPVYRYSGDTGPGVALGGNVSPDWAPITPTGGRAGSAATAKPTTVGQGEVDGLGPVLTDRTGKTLYLFTKDGKDAGRSTCDGACATTWPPLLADGRITVAESIDTKLIGRIRRPDGTTQVTVGGWPVYTYAKDDAPGTANGHGVGKTWYALEPNGCRVDPSRTPARSPASTGG